MKRQKSDGKATITVSGTLVHGEPMIRLLFGHDRGLVEFLRIWFRNHQAALSLLSLVCGLVSPYGKSTDKDKTNDYEKKRGGRFWWYLINRRIGVGRKPLQMR